MCWSVRHSVHLHRALQLAGEQAERDELRVRADLVAEAAADVLRDEAELVHPDPQRRRHHDDREAGELVVRSGSSTARCRGCTRRARPLRLERRRREAVEVQPLDPDDLVGLGERRVVVAPVERRRARSRSSRPPRAGAARPRPARARGRRARASGSYSTSTSSAASRASSRVAATTAATGSPTWRTRADRERVVLDVPAGRRRDLEERVGLRRDLVAGQRPVDAVELERLRDVDRARSRACAYGERTKWT